jgi:hypothetical protein
MKRQHLHTLRDVSLVSAGVYRGMRNVYMAQASMKSVGPIERKTLVKLARESHHTYLARLREASGAPGYRAMEEIVAADITKAEPTYQSGFMTRKQAGGAS